MADGVMAVEWSTSSEWVLMTGGCDGAIRYWDIRRAGCFLVLDQSKSQLGRRPPLLERSVADKVSFIPFSAFSLALDYVNIILKSSFVSDSRQKVLDSLYG